MKKMGEVEDNEELTLHPSTMAALTDFLREREERERELKCISGQDAALKVSFEEDWQLSQFWYDEETTDLLVKGALNSTQPDGRIALISCPTIYRKLKQTCGERQVTLFEYDNRFKVYGSDFVPYNYKYPLALPRDMSIRFDLVIADPPFLSDECLTKTALTVKFLSKRDIVLCTGAVMAELAERLLDVKTCAFVPRHKNNLANEFHCYSNFNFDQALK